MSRAMEAPSRIARLVTATVALSVRFPWLVMLVTTVTLLLGVAAAMYKLEYHTQRNDLLSAEKEIQKRWQRYLDAFGDDDDMIFVIKGGNRKRMMAASDDLAARLRLKTDIFDRVFHQVDLRPIYSRSLLFLKPEEIQAVERRLDGMAPLLGPLGQFAWPTLTLEALMRQAISAKEDRGAGRGISTADRDLLDQFPSVLQSAIDTMRNPDTYFNPWRIGPADDRQQQLQEPQYFFTLDGQLVMVLARPRKAADSFTPALAACDAARKIVAEAQKEFPDLSIGLTGIPVLETDEMAASDEDSTKASWLALIGVALLYMIVYRGIRYPLYTVGTLLVGTAWALGWATLTVGHLNILSATFAVMIIGMGDYGVLWVSRYDEERKLGRSVSEALRETSIHSGPSIVTAAITTALAFFATIFADFKAVAELGWIAGSGVMFCALACLTVLPAAITLVERFRLGKTVVASAAEAPEVLPFPQPFLPGLSHQPKLVLIVFAMVVFVLSAFALRVGYDSNLLKMQAAGLDSVTWEQELITHAAGATWDAMSVAKTHEEALQRKSKYESMKEVSRVVDAASLIPTNQQQKLPLLQAIQQKLKSLPNTVSQGAVSDPSALRKMLARWPSPTLEAMLQDPVAVSRLQLFDSRLRADLLGDLQTLRSVSTPQPITLEMLPSDFRERYIGNGGEFLVRAFAAESLWDYDALLRFTKSVREADPEATGKSFRTLEGLQQMKQGFEKAGVMALFVIVVVLWLDLRGFQQLLLGLFPLAIGVLATLGLMGICGVPLNPANLIALPLIVGVGVDNGVHVLHDYADRIRGKLYRLGAATGRGILVAALTTILGFGTLCLSRHRGMASLGFALTLGVTFCMLAALVALPAILRLRDAHLLRNHHLHAKKRLQKAA